MWHCANWLGLSIAQYRSYFVPRPSNVAVLWHRDASLRSLLWTWADKEEQSSSWQGAALVQSRSVQLMLHPWPLFACSWLIYNFGVMGRLSWRSVCVPAAGNGTDLDLVKVVVCPKAISPLSARIEHVQPKASPLVEGQANRVELLAVSTKNTSSIDKLTRPKPTSWFLTVARRGSAGYQTSRVEKMRCLSWGGGLPTPLDS